ncbi:hypothetical protein RB608_24830 [Nocardioides sp. LHD-245]|uniref:hypothetical protein n=1 Tax=Nocardioides sp. LHD-245 TaxID=3051387 RepID=UPI0027E08AE6|nr:hypothetical protein [Nocardioides sp. LHD-245]
MAGPVKIAILASGSQARREFNQTAGAMDRLGSHAKKLAGAGFLAAGAAVTKLGIDSVKAASSAEQSLGATEAVFKRYADTVIGRSMDASEAIGVSANEYRELSTVTGAMLKNAGTPLKQVTDLTDKLNRRAADLAATYGGSTREAIESVNSLLRGEADPIERYGISIKQSDVNARMAARGLDKLEGSAKKTAEQQARLELLFRQSKDAAGQFGRESDTIAGKGQRLGAKVTDLEAKFGKLLIPALSEAADWASDDLVPALDDLAGWIETNRDEIADFGGTIKGAVLPPLKATTELVGDAVSLFADLPDPVEQFAVQAGIAALVVPKLTAGIGAATTATTLQVAKLKQLRAELSYTETRTQLTGTAMGKLGAGVKTVAGVGGLVALTSGLSAAADEGANFGSVLQGAAGGAGIGAMFGPVGALVGAGVGGGLSALAGAFGETAAEAEATRLELLRSQGFDEAKADADNLREALLGVKNAYGETARAAVKASFTGKDGKLDADIARLRELGVSMDTVVSAAMGQANAQRVVDQALAGQLGTLQKVADQAKAAYDDVADGAKDLVTATGQVIKNGDALEPGEIDRYRSAWLDAKGAVDEAKIAQDTFNQRVRESGAAISDHGAQVQDLATKLGLTVTQYKQFPKEIRTHFEDSGLAQTGQDAVRLIGDYKALQSFDNIKAIVSAPGVDLTGKQVRELNKTYGLTPDQLRTLIKTEGLAKTKGDIDKLATRLSTVGNVKVPLKGWVQGLQQALDQGASISDREKKLIIKKLNAIEEAKPNLAPYVRAVKKSINNAKTEADASTQVGDALKQGLLNGMAGTGAALEVIMRSAVRQAIKGARDEGGIESPSKETTYLGRMLGEGLAGGMEATTPVVGRAGTKLAKGALDGIFSEVTKGSDEIDKALENLTREIEKAIKPGKGRNGQQREEKREAAVLKSLKGQYDQLVANGKEQDRINDLLGEKVEKEQAAYDQLRAAKQAQREYADAIRNTITATGDVTQLGRVEGMSDEQLKALEKKFADQPETLARILASQGSGVSIDLLLNQLEDKAVQAENFQRLMEELAAKGLSQGQIEQMLAAGPEAALATAEAISLGGDSAIRQMNRLQDRLVAAGGVLGDNMAARYKQAGIDAAQGLVNGLESQLAAVQAAAAAIAAALTNTVKIKLKVKSPSRVFRDIGDDVMRGLDIGIDDTVASRAGARAATSLTRGFGDPALEAKATYLANSGNASSQTLTVKLTAEEASLLQQGREIVMKIDYARANGVMAATF